MNIKILFDTNISLQNAVNQLLQPVIGGFKAVTARVVDDNEQVTDAYCSVIHCNEGESQDIPVHDVAAVLDCYDVLTTEVMEAAYEKIKLVKSLNKPEMPRGDEGEKYMSTGIIVARSSDLTLEQISSEMDRLNGVEPSHFWPDAVAVLSLGLVNYTASVPVLDNSGDFFLPAAQIVAWTPSPSMYVYKIIRPTGDDTFIKVASLIIARVAVYQPGVDVMDYNKLLKDVSSLGLVTQGYQFNLASRLMPLSRAEVVSTKLPRKTYNIVSGKERLGSVQYQSWQDGGVFIVHGKFPIEPFLIFLNTVVPGLTADELKCFRGPDVQISFVLPVNEMQFLQTLSIFEQRSANISIEREEGKLIVQKVGDEGAASPFVARLMLGIMSIRDSAYKTEEDRLHFDEFYEQVMSGLQNAREASQDIAEEWSRHQSNIETGSIVNMRGGQVHIGESIDRLLKRDLESFLNTVVRTIKHSLQSLTKHMGVDIGCLFQKESPFLAGIEEIRELDPSLADYLLAARQWCEPLVLLRNELEHRTVLAPKVSYIVDGQAVRVEEPVFNDQPITDFTTEALDRICCFAEEITMHCLRAKLENVFEINELPVTERDSTCPVRFQVTVMPGGQQPWALTPHTKAFNEA